MNSDYHLLKGPLGGYKNYLYHIVFNNCIDYFNCIKKQREKGKNTTPDHYQRLRFFINALESLNNVLDYMYFDLEYDKKDKSLIQFRNILYSLNPNLKNINDLANASKHCVRGRWDMKKNVFIKKKKGKHASDIAKHDIKFRVGMRVQRLLVETILGFDAIDGEEMITSAFKFWHNHVENCRDDLYTKISSAL